ncbi:hypothetical protein ACLBWP_02895 [Microbacterium sp. M1A1_1b]|uniref:hypothetical protein n=1 Tax=Curtobacterium sp. VKM Ac-2922 TaxID=2929475 RepID=UPI001FB44A0B|nr:hypothetical protein [Curtobacterium sp. VKM Ac-2922]MCJ1715549.1 hypothetical protein [Curtobacterium sp. VKM Ac-2922]
MTPETVAVARFADDRWHVRSVEYPQVAFESIWLDQALQQVTDALGRYCDPRTAVAYEVEGMCGDAEFRLARTVTGLVRTAREHLRALEGIGRPLERELLQQLAEHRMLPSEVATMLDVDLASAERVMGTEGESRIARSILTRARTAPTGATPAAPPLPEPA